MNDDRLAFTIEEAARAIGISRGGAYRSAHTGELPTVRIGGRLLVPRDALKELIAERARRRSSEATV
jgi:excisionase family DNA binding protein